MNEAKPKGRQEDTELERLKRENEVLRARAENTESFLQGLTAVSSDMFWRTNAEHRIIYVSSAIEKVFNANTGFLQGKRRQDLADEDTTTEKWLKHQDDLDNHRPFENFDYFTRGATGLKRRIVTSGKPEFDGEGNFLGFIGVSRDITNEAIERDRLRANEASLIRAIAINAVDSTFSLWDADDRLILCNDRFRSVNPAVEGTIRIGATFEEVMRGLAMHYLNGKVSDVEAWVRWRVERHKNPRGPFEVLRSDGNAMLVHEAHTEDGSTITIASDITAWKDTELALRASEQRLRDFSAVAADWMWEMDENLRFSYFSREMRDYEFVNADVLIGKTRRDLSVGGVSEEQLLAHEECLEAHRAFRDFRYFKIRPDGERMYVSVSGKPVFDDEGKFKGYRGVGQDITDLIRIQNELRAAKERAEEASRAKSEFLAHMSHELRTPLNAILGFSEVIKEQLFGPVENSSYVEYAKDIHSSGEHLLSLINDLLDLSKIEAGKFKVVEEDLDIADVVANTQKLFARRFKRRGIVCTADIAPDATGLRADRRALSQLLFNLVSNAEKYNRENGRIEIRSYRDDLERFCLEVSDIGFGFDAADFEKALSPFERIENPMTSVSDGTGLGLTIVHALMKMHDGYVDMQSEINVGTKVTLVFPATRAVSV